VRGPRRRPGTGDEDCTRRSCSGLRKAVVAAAPGPSGPESVGRTRRWRGSTARWPGRRGEATLTSWRAKPASGKTALVSTWCGLRTGDVLLLSAVRRARSRPPAPAVLDGPGRPSPFPRPDAAARCWATPTPCSDAARSSSARARAQTGPTTSPTPPPARRGCRSLLWRLSKRAAGGRTGVIVAEDIHLAERAGRVAAVRGTAGPATAGHRHDCDRGPGPSAPPTGAARALDVESVAALVARNGPTISPAQRGHPLFLLELASATSPELPASVRDPVAGRSTEWARRR